jgi:hypothetical protein
MVVAVAMMRASPAKKMKTGMETSIRACQRSPMQ